MFFIDRIRKLFGTSRVQAFLLEILAIFIGITGSLLVDEWRQERQEKAEYRALLGDIYFDALRAETGLNRLIYGGMQQAMAMDRLLRDDLDLLPDSELQLLLVAATNELYAPTPIAAVQSLKNNDLPITQDESLQQILNNDLYREVFSSVLDRQVEGHSALIGQLLERIGVLSEPAVNYFDETQNSLTVGIRSGIGRYAGIEPVLQSHGYYLSSGLDSTELKLNLSSDESRQLLLAALERLMRAIDARISMIGVTVDIKRVIKDRMPELRLPVRRLGLLGSATPGGWTVPQAAPLQPDSAGSDWWSAELELADGMVKFIANDNYGTSWGAPYAWSSVDALSDATHYLGDPAEVFPRGTAILDGQNIPVEAGRYRVRLNVHTFAYEFNRTGPPVRE